MELEEFENLFRRFVAERPERFIEILSTPRTQDALMRELEFRTGRRDILKASILVLSALSGLRISSELASAKVFVKQGDVYVDVWDYIKQKLETEGFKYIGDNLLRKFLARQGYFWRLDDMLNFTVSGSASYSLDSRLRINTGTTANSYVVAKKYVSNDMISKAGVATWDNRKILYGLFYAKPGINASSPHIQILCGSGEESVTTSITKSHIGLILYDGYLYASVADGNNQTTVKLAGAYSSGNIAVEICVFCAEFIPNDKVVFDVYAVNGMGTEYYDTVEITTNLPSGGSYASNLFWFLGGNKGGSDDNIQLWDAAVYSEIV